jgi:hypothetical protein
MWPSDRVIIIIIIKTTTNNNNNNNNSVVSVRERTIPTERSPLVGEDSDNFCGERVPRGQLFGSLRPYSRISRPEPLLFLPSSFSIVLTRLSGPPSRHTPGIDPGPLDLQPETLTTRPQRRSPVTGWPCYTPQALGSLFVAFYGPQGYGEPIKTRFRARNLKHLSGRRIFRLTSYGDVKRKLGVPWAFSITLTDFRANKKKRLFYFFVSPLRNQV